MTFAKRLNVKKGKDFIALKEFERRYIPLDDLAEDTGGHFVT